MIGLILGVMLIIVGAWSDFKANHATPLHPSPYWADIRIAGLVAIFVGGILIVAWIGGLMRF